MECRLTNCHGMTAVSQRLVRLTKTNGHVPKKGRDFVVQELARSSHKIETGAVGKWASTHSSNVTFR